MLVPGSHIHISIYRWQVTLLGSRINETSWFSNPEITSRTICGTLYPPWAGLSPSQWQMHPFSSFYFQVSLNVISIFSCVVATVLFWGVFLGCEIYSSTTVSTNQTYVCFFKANVITRLNTIAFCSKDWIEMQKTSCKRMRIILHVNYISFANISCGFLV